MYTEKLEEKCSTWSRSTSIQASEYNSRESPLVASLIAQLSSMHDQAPPSFFVNRLLCRGRSWNRVTSMHTPHSDRRKIRLSLHQLSNRVQEGLRGEGKSLGILASRRHYAAVVGASVVGWPPCRRCNPRGEILFGAQQCVRSLGHGYMLLRQNDLVRKSDCALAMVVVLRLCEPSI